MGSSSRLKSSYMSVDYNTHSRFCQAADGLTERAGALLHSLNIVHSKSHSRVRAHSQRNIYCTRYDWLFQNKFFTHVVRNHTILRQINAKNWGRHYKNKISLHRPSSVPKPWTHFIKIDMTNCVNWPYSLFDYFSIYMWKSNYESKSQG